MSNCCVEYKIFKLDYAGLRMFVVIEKYVQL